MKYMVFGIVAVLAMVGMANGAWNGWDPSESYENNINAIFNDVALNDSVNPGVLNITWTMGDKPVRAVDGTPMGSDEQEQIDYKTSLLIGHTDPYGQPAVYNKPTHAIDGSWGKDTEQDLVDGKVAAFLSAA